jgi:hypothetical protein
LVRDDFGFEALKRKPLTQAVTGLQTTKVPNSDTALGIAALTETITNARRSKTCK